MKKRFWPIVASSLLAGPWAAAHHSTAAYDHTRTITLRGTIQDFQWTNPHSYIDLLVPDRKGRIIRWVVECGAPNLNVRHGWQPNSIKAGDQVTVVIFPIRDGSAQGTLDTVTLADGKVLPGAARFLAAQLGQLGVPGAHRPAASTPHN